MKHLVVVDSGWDSSSWMGQEAHFALEAPGAKRHLRGYLWNPEGRQVKAAGMVGYLRQGLPADIDEACDILAEVAGGRT